VDTYIYFRAWIPYQYDTVLDLLNNWDDRGAGRSGRVSGSLGRVAGSLGQRVGGLLDWADAIGLLGEVGSDWVSHADVESG